MKILGQQIKLYFKQKLTENWSYEIEFMKWTGFWKNFTIFENSVYCIPKGDYRGLYWSYYILGFKVIELNVFDHSIETKLRYDYPHGLDT